MSSLSTIAPQAATGPVAEIYQQMEQALGRVPNALQLFSVSPTALELQWRQLGYYFPHPTLGFPLLATLRLLISQDSDCRYCIGMNEAMLIQRAGFTPEQIAAAKGDPAEAPLPEKDKALLLAALKATRAPKSVSTEELDALRTLGWTDQDIFDAVNHAAQHAAIDILFNTFKVESDF